MRYHNFNMLPHTIPYIFTQFNMVLRLFATRYHQIYKKILIYIFFINDNTLYKSGKNMQKIKNDLEMDFIILHKWLHENHMVLNPGKSHYIVISDANSSHKIILNNNEIASSNELLGILLDSKLSFEFHIIYISL